MLLASGLGVVRCGFAAPIALSGEDRRKLDKWASSRSTPVRLRERSRIVLMAAEGMANKDIAVELGI